jgi:signal transduction histidine kinase
MPDDDVDYRYPPKPTADGMLKSNKQELISKTEELKQTSDLLLASNDALKSKTEELDKTNKALFESNHELASVNRELAATNTRFAETNERFAQVNEELSALNEELALSNEQIKSRDKILTDFVNIAAHEFRTPTQSILGYSELLQLLFEEEEQSSFNEKANDEKKKALDSIIRNANRLDKLATNILDVTRIDGNILILNKQRFNLNEKIRNVVSDIVNRMGKNTGNNKNIKIAFESKAGANEIYIEADKLRVYQVISNLLSNAVKFTKDGNITITADVNTNEEEVIVKITDTGTGIATDILPKLFSKFATGSSEGVGLGLFISKSIVEAHGGRIWAENNNNTDNTLKGQKGATFAFSLPYFAN